MSPAPHDLDPPAMTEQERLAKRRYQAYFAFEMSSENRCPECASPVEVWADRSDGVTVNFECLNDKCRSGKPPWDTPRPLEES